MRRHADAYSRIIGKTLDRLIPFTVHWELTYRCNLRCPHCYVIPQNSQRELSLGEITSIFDLLRESGTLYLVFSGGEILTREDFFEVAASARKRGFALRLITNGTLLDEWVADRIRDLHPLSVEISLYGSRPEIHDRITACPGSFERSLKALRLLRERSVRTVLKSLMMKGNVGDFQGLKKLARDTGSQFVYDTIVIPKMDGSTEPCVKRLDGHELFRLLYLDVQEKGDDWDRREKDLSCSAGLNALSVSPHGDVYPCMGFKESGGNLTKNSLSEIYHSPVFSKIRSITLSDLRECRECHLMRYCNRCPALALMETGDLLGPSQADCLLAGVIKSIIEDKRERALMEHEMR